MEPVGGHAGCFIDAGGRQPPVIPGAVRSPPRQRGQVSERRQLEIRTARLQSTKAEIATRLQRVCPGMPPDEFDRMVEDMAVIEIKYSIRRGIDLFTHEDEEG